MSGLKSINERLDKVEQQTKAPEPAGFVEVVLGQMKSKQEVNQKGELQKVHQAYQKNLSVYVDVSKPESIMVHLTTIVEFTVRFIEANIKRIGSILGISVDSQLKLQTAINFIKDIVSDLFHDVLIINTINSWVKILFPKVSPLLIENDAASIVEVPVNKANSLKKAKKFILKKSCVKSE